uniref:G-protein coupled receptors family 1 profile domain-containing protein n=1 Tax=Terrapene triunguis TaxID=2587831 RepID=A0A674KAV4_9SAUR
MTVGFGLSNRTTMIEFLLLGFSDVQKLQILHFVVFLVLYLASLMGNLLIITAIALDHHLDSPMYFFLVNLSILDLGSISVTIPKSMANSLMNTRFSYSGCITQVFLLLFFASADSALLTIMTVMNRRACVQMVAIAWICSNLYSALNTENTFVLTFCGGNVVYQFFCEILQLFKLTSSDSYLSETGVIVFSVCFALIIVSYVHIFMTVLRIPSEQGWHKAFCTCLPHLTVVFLFFCTGSFAHLKPTSSSASGLDLVVAVLYSVVPPTMNPVIYSMRNKENKAALRRLTVWKLFTKNNMFVFLP